MSPAAHFSTSLSRSAPWLVFGAAVALAAVRAPRLLLEPRFWAEEGAVYYAAALHAPWLEALLHRHSAGYLLLSASAPATLAARLFPLELGPASPPGPPSRCSLADLLRTDLALHPV